MVPIDLYMLENANNLFLLSFD